MKEEECLLGTELVIGLFRVKKVDPKSLSIDSKGCSIKSFYLPLTPSLEVVYRLTSAPFIILLNLDISLSLSHYIRC